jgi:hypothetical protein
VNVLPAALVTAAALALSACATGTKTPNTSVIDLANDVVLTSVPLSGVAVHATLSKPTVQTGSGFRSTDQNFCPANGGSLVRAREQFADLCKVKGGAFDGSFCRRRDGNDDVPFMAKVASRGTGGCYSLNVAEPTEGVGGPDYLSYLVKYGYETEAARRQATAQRAAEAMRRSAEARSQAAAKAEADRARLTLELPRMRKRGTLVCMDDGRQTFVGYVEDFTDEKLKVLVSRGFLTQAPSVSLRVEPGTLRWDEFAVWRLCQ